MNACPVAMDVHRYCEPDHEAEHVGAAQVAFDRALEKIGNLPPADYALAIGTLLVELFDAKDLPHRLEPLVVELSELSDKDHERLVEWFDRAVRFLS
jgi:hypothetical protein